MLLSVSVICGSYRPYTLFGADLQYSEKGFLRNLDAADALHPLLAFLLPLEQLPLSRDVAAVALGEHVLALRLDRLPRDHARADRRLHRNVEQLARDLLAQLVDERSAAAVRGPAVEDQRERVDRLAGDEHVQLDEVALAEADDVVVEAGVAARPRLQLIVEVDHDLCERQLVDQ